MNRRLLERVRSRMGEEFMPPLDEGSFLYMPTVMPHASIGEALDVLKKLDMAVSAIPEVELIVGKLGRVDSSLDPAPISMFENIINYKSEYLVDAAGHPISFQYDPATAEFVRDEQGRLIPDERGRPKGRVPGQGKRIGLPGAPWPTQKRLPLWARLLSRY